MFHDPRPARVTTRDNAAETASRFHIVIPDLSRRHLLWMVILAALYLIPRLNGVDRLITSDETLWLGRSANFYTAFVHRDWANTYQFVHPGVMTMWAGAIGYFIALPNYPILHPGQYATTALIHIPIRDQMQDPLFVIVAARFVKLMFQLTFFLIAIRFCRLLFGRRIAVATAIMLSFEPFLIAHDRLLHIDGLFSISSFAAIMCIAWAGECERSLRLWCLAGVLSAMAWLTRSTGIVLAPAAAFAMLLPYLIAARGRRLPRRSEMATILRSAVAFGLAATVTTFALFPALWVTPLSVGQRMRAWSEEAATAGHEAPIIWAGRIIGGDPGQLYYPVTFLFRLSPPTVIGVVLAIVWCGWNFRRRRPELPWRPMLVILAFAFAYGLGMSLGAKKFDRYVLPDYPVLDLIAAVGWVASASSVWHARKWWLRALAVVLVLTPMGGQAVSAADARPYGLDYFSPLIGGISGADGNIIIGWGEGMDLAAEWILAQPGGNTATVLTSANRTSLLYFMPDSVNVLPPRVIGSQDALEDWFGADYFVSYILQWQRNAQFEERGYIDQFPPAHVIVIDGVEFARIYDLNQTPVPPAILAGAACSWNFDNHLSLMESTRGFVNDPLTQRRSRVYQLTFVTGSNPLPTSTYIVRIRLDPVKFGAQPIEQDFVLTPSITTGVPSSVETVFRLPFGALVSNYRVQVIVFDPVTGEPIVARQPLLRSTSSVAYPDACDRLEPEG